MAGIEWSDYDPNERDGDPDACEARRTGTFRIKASSGIPYVTKLIGSQLAPSTPCASAEGIRPHLDHPITKHGLAPTRMLGVPDD